GPARSTRRAWLATHLPFPPPGDDPTMANPGGGSRLPPNVILREGVSSMNPWNFLAGGAALGVLAGLWDQIKAVGWKVVNLLIQQVEFPTDAAHEAVTARSEEHTSELQSHLNLVCRLLLEKKKQKKQSTT